MNRLYQVPDDFEATIRIYSRAEGGRVSPPFNGIRWDFGYADDPPGSSIYMIYPDFFDENGNSLPTDVRLRVGVELRARMTVLSDNMRAEVHRSRIKEGLKFFCHEGNHRVAEGHVTRITGLFDERQKRI